MANWKYTINLKDVWKKYSEFDHSDYDEDNGLFERMKKEMLAAIEIGCRPSDYAKLTEIGTIGKLKNANFFQ